MSKRLVFGLLILLVLVLLFKYPIWLEYQENIEKILGREIHYDPPLFFTIFLFPFSLSLLFLYFFIKYKNNYDDIAKWFLIIIISLAVVFAFHGLFGVCPRLTHGLPILGGLLGVLVLSEGYLSISLVLLFIALFFFAFGKKKTVKKVGT